MTGMTDIGTMGEDHGEVTFPGAGGGPERPVPPARAANAGPAADDDVTEWFGPVSTEPAPPEDDGPWWPGVRVTACTVAAGLLVGTLAALAYRHVTRPAGEAAATRQAAVRSEAAGWVARQVSRQDMISCDQAMCAALRASGFPPYHLLVLGPTSDNTVTASSDVVVETPAVRALFGTSLDGAWAPAILASFGPRSDRVTVRVIAPNGAAAYQVAVSAAQAASQAAGARLLRNPRVTVQAAAAGPLAAGMVDARLLQALAALAQREPVRITGFGNTGTGASADVPLRFADLAMDEKGGAAYLKSVRAVLSTMSPALGLLPATTVTPRHGPPALRLQVTAPTPSG